MRAFLGAVTRPRLHPPALLRGSTVPAARARCPRREGMAAVADRWHVAAHECRAENSVVYGPGNRSARYAELATEAAGRPVPGKVRLKDPSQFRIIGKRVRRLDSKAKCDGSQKFGLDV